MLLTRTSRRNNRPLLKQGNPREILGRLIALRYPVYAEADIAVDSIDVPPEETVDRVLKALEAWPGVTKTDGSRIGPSDREAQTHREAQHMEKSTTCRISSASICPSAATTS